MTHMPETTRDTLINHLKDAINKNCNSNVTFEQVEHYIGSDMANAKIEHWLDETETMDSGAVTAQEVLELWENQ